MKKIGIVEDETFMREELEMLLQDAGYEVCSITSFAHISDQLLSASPDLILLDVNLPEKSGFQICREVKLKMPIPIVMLTSRDQMRDELHALEIGADEYLTKPCRKERLLARIANVLKRYEGRKNLLQGRDFLLDRQTYTLYIHDESVILPKNQGKMLEIFLTSEEGMVSKEDLSIALWNTEKYIDENALQVNVTRLKKTMVQLKMNEKIMPVRGYGYQLVTEDEENEAI